MKHRSGWNKDKTPRAEVLLEGNKDFSNGNDPYEEPKGNIIRVRHWFAMVPQELLFDGSISGQAKALYGIYHCYATQKHSPETRVDRDKVKSHLGVSAKQVTRLKQVLIKTGWIEVRHRGQGKSDIITLNEFPLQKNDFPEKRKFQKGQKRPF